MHCNIKLALKLLKDFNNIIKKDFRNGLQGRMGYEKS